MPGIVGLLRHGGDGDLDANLSAMLLRMKHHPWYVEESSTDAALGLGLGRMALGFLDRAEQPASRADGGLLAVLSGEIHNHVELRRRLESQGVRLGNDGFAELILAGYEHSGKDFFREIEGSFAAAIWDGQNGKLVLATDRFGMKPLYYSQTADAFLFGSEIKSLLVHDGVDKRPNERGIAQFFTYGMFFCQDTFLEGVTIVPAGAWVAYDPVTKKVTEERYWRLGEAKVAGARNQGDWLERIDSAFQAAVAMRAARTPNLGLSLSGGLDARSILAVMDHRKMPITTICMGMEGSMDHDSSRRMAELAGCKHHAHYLKADFLSRFEDHMRWMVHLTDGHYLCQVIVMPTLPTYQQLGIEVLMRGHAGELMHMHKAYAYSMDAEALSIGDDAALERWLFKHLQAYMLQELEVPLFRPGLQRVVADHARDSLREALREAETIATPLQRIWHVFINQRLRRETSLSMVEFNSLMEIRLPFLGNDLVDLLLSAPPDLKLGETIQTYILKHHFPAFLGVRNANTGTRVGASELARKISTFRMRVFAKLGVKGYQPYERLGLWLRREIADTVRRILLGPQCLDRGVFEPDGVKAVVEGHLSARRNHTFLLLAMMIYELGQREFIDATDSNHYSALHGAS